ncbi:MAG: nucleotidyl transferase AbiEii/AbiGii toxin family protein [Deltaproteobacteria bacterium]|nr:nucleotidyl transferase AbiEii/AbiGii toxin family protein [Deltaproteobacteria bacterium]
MTEYTRPATWEDVKLLATLLARHGVAWALIGGYAVGAHGFVRFSEDVDILVDPSPENARRWIAALSELPDGAARELEGEDDVFEREGQYAIRVNDEFTVDVMPAAGGHGWSELSRFIEEREIDDVCLPVLGLEGLLLTKEGGRDKDRADARVLRSALERLRGGRDRGSD